MCGAFLDDWAVTLMVFYTCGELVLREVGPIFRILKGEKHPEIKLQRLQKIPIWTFGSLVHQINSI